MLKQKIVVDSSWVSDTGDELASPRLRPMLCLALAAGGCLLGMHRCANNQSTSGSGPGAGHRNGMSRITRSLDEKREACIRQVYSTKGLPGEGKSTRKDATDQTL